MEWRILIEDFMRIECVEISLGPCTNISGLNENGKTAVLKALYLMTTGVIENGTVLADYIRFGQRGYTIKLWRDDAELSLRRTQTGSTWKLNGERLSAKALNELRQEWFWPNIRNIPPEGMRVFLDAERFVELSDRDRVALLLPEVIDGEFEEDVQAVVAQWDDADLIARLSEFLRQNGIALNSLDSIKRATETAVDKRRFAKRRISDLNSTAKALENWIASQSQESRASAQALETEMNDLQLARDYLLEERGAVKRGTDTVTGLDNPRYDPGPHPTEIQKQVLEYHAMGEDLRLCKQTLEQRLEFGDDESLRAEERKCRAQIRNIQLKLPEVQVGSAHIQEQYNSARSEWTEVSQQAHHHSTCVDMLENSDIAGCPVCMSTYTEQAVGMYLDFHKSQITALEEEAASLKEQEQRVLEDSEKLGKAVEDLRAQEQALTERLNNIINAQAVSISSVEEEITMFESSRAAMADAVRSSIRSDAMRDVEARISVIDAEIKGVTALTNALRVYSEKSAELAGHKEEIEKLQEEIRWMDRIEHAMGATGVLGQLLNSKMTDWSADLNDALNALTTQHRDAPASFTEFDLGQIHESESQYVPFNMLSASAQQRSLTALQYANAMKAGFPFLVVDNGELNDAQHRSELVNFAYSSGLKSIIVNSGTRPIINPERLQTLGINMVRI